MKGTEKKDIVRPSKNGYYLVLFLILIITITAGIFSLCDKLFELIKWDAQFSNLVGIACQVLTGIVCCIQSILGLSISLQHQDVLGISLSKYYTLRNKPYFDYKTSALISVGLLLISVVSFSLSLNVLCIATALVSAFFGFYLLCVELPILTLRENAIINIVRDRFIQEYNGIIKADDYQSRTYVEMIETLICNKNLKWVYSHLSIESKKDYNQCLLYRLLDIQSNLSFHLDKIESSSKLVQITDEMLFTVCEMTCSDFDIVEILDENPHNYLHFLTCVFFRLLEKTECKEKTEERIALMATSIFVPTKTQAHFDLYFSVITILVIDRIKQNDWSLAEKVKMHWSLMPYSLHSEGVSTRIFAMISFIIYYLAEINTSVPEETKKRIRSFAESGGIRDNTEVLTWNNLFQEFADDFTLSYDNFISDYQKNENYYDYDIYSSRAQYIQLTFDLASNWYLAHFLNRNKSFKDIDYESVFYALNNMGRTDFLKRFEDNCYSSAQRSFNPSEKIVKIASYYSKSEPEFAWFKMEENRCFSFRNYIDSLRKQEFKNRINEAIKINNQDLMEHYQPLLEKRIQNIFGFDSSIDLSKEQKRVTSFLLDKDHAIQISEIVITRFLMGRFLEFRQNGLREAETIIQAGESFLQSIRSMLKKRIQYVTSDVLCWEDWISDEATRSKFVRIVKDAKQIECPQGLFTRPTLIVGDGFRFNCEVQFMATDLTPNQLDQLASQYRRADGQYVYESAFLNRDELLNIIKQTKVFIQIVFSYKIKTSKNSIYVLDMFPKETINE